MADPAALVIALLTNVIVERVHEGIGEVSGRVVVATLSPLCVVFFRYPEGMSISHFVDDWFEDNGLQPIVEVEPDHACQVFLPEDGVILSAVDYSSESRHTAPDVAVELVRDFLA